MRKLNKRSVTTFLLLVVMGLLFLGIILLVSFGFVGGMMTMLQNLVKNAFFAGASKIVNPDSLYTRASDASFDRLNYEIEELLKDRTEGASRVIPYTLGQRRLVGINKANTINEACLDGKMVQLKGPECEGKACLCLCTREESCSCKPYIGVDYFITTEDSARNHGEKIPEAVEPFTGESAYCLYLRGAFNEEERWKLLEPFSTWWHSNNILIKKTVINGETAILISRVQDLPGADWQDCDTTKLDTSGCSLQASCFDYQSASMGCDWRYLCQNNVCKDITGLACGVIKIPETESYEKEEVCAPEGKTVSDICIMGSLVGPGYAIKGERISDEIYDLCFECAGIGATGADATGWTNVAGVGSADCIP
jgi:hypothetical protein